MPVRTPNPGPGAHLLLRREEIGGGKRPDKPDTIAFVLGLPLFPRSNRGTPRKGATSSMSGCDKDNALPARKAPRSWNVYGSSTQSPQKGDVRYVVVDE
jgi:hypothetical protein